MITSRFPRIILHCLAGTLGLTLLTHSLQAEPVTDPAGGLRDVAAIEAEQLLAPNEVRILDPQPGLVDHEATAITLQYALGSTVSLNTNGIPVSATLVGRTETNTTLNLVTQTWYGVILAKGTNTITAQAGGGQPVAIEVEVRGLPTTLILKADQPQISADGRATTTLKGELTDALGNRSQRESLVTLTTETGSFVGADADLDQPGFQVKATEGQFNATFQAGIKAQTNRIQASAYKLATITEIELLTDLRPSVATGVIDVRLGAKGLDYYRPFEDFLNPEHRSASNLDVQSKVFATGRLGDWLFTGAYNNTHSLNQDCNGTAQLSQETQTCDESYPVYGDSSSIERLAESRDYVFLRLERNKDYVMWGDYDLKEFATEAQKFTAITRRLHGFKANYNLGDLQGTAFYGDNVQGFQRDAVAPDGTSGYYFLSRRLIIPGSEVITIELEEFQRPGTVIDSQTYSRGVDYDIDYDRGTVLFRQPILKTDIDQYGTVLVRRIIATYQYEGAQGANIYGGRLQYHFSRESGQEKILGMTYIQENQGVRQFQLYGSDLLLNWDSGGQLIAEYAHSNNDSDVVGPVSGAAYRLEVKQLFGTGLSTRAYWRHADTGFSNNATTSFVPGQTRYGFDLVALLSPETNLRASFDHEDNNGTAPQPLVNKVDLFNPGTTALPGSRVDNSLTTISAGIFQKLGQATLELDYIQRQRQDRILETTTNSSQLRSRFTYPLADKLTLRAQNELTLTKESDIVYPDRTVIGLDWAVLPGISLQLNHQFFSSSTYAANSITSLDLAGDYKLGADTTLLGRYSVLSGISGPKGQGSLGLNHKWTVSPGLKIDLSYEHLFGSIFTGTGAGAQYSQPFAVGQASSSLGLEGGDSYSIGFEYLASDDLKATARYEHRTSGGGSNTVISSGVVGKLSPSLTGLLKYDQANSSNQQLVGLGDTINFKLGIAFRDPLEDRFNALLRYEYRQNPSTIPDTILLGSGTGNTSHTLALEALYTPDWQWEFYGKLALRTSTTQIAQDFTSASTIGLVQGRATYRLGYNVDLVAEARAITQSVASYGELGGTVEVGYYLSP